MIYMNKTLLVIRQEIASTFARRSYLLFAFGFPLLAILVVGGLKIVQGRSGNPGATAGGSSVAQKPSDLDREGFVDLSGLIRSIPDGFAASSRGRVTPSVSRGGVTPPVQGEGGNNPSDTPPASGEDGYNPPDTSPRPGGLIAYPDEAQAKQALIAGEIEAFYVIPADYLRTGKIAYVYPDTKSYLAGGQEWAIQWVLTVNLLEGDLELADRVWNPVYTLRETSIASASQAGTLTGEDCTRPGMACRSNKLIRYLPVLMVVFLFAALMISSTMLFNSVGIEKENRTIEVLMVSIHPRQLMTGKVVALGLAGLLQTAAWLGATFVLLNLQGTALRIPDNFTFPIEILAWSLLLFLGGYILYASLMAAAGALVPHMKEAGMASVIIILPLLAGYMVGLFASIARASQAVLPVALSLFPLTAPVVMVMRLTDSAVPWWQALISVGLTYMAAWLALDAAAGIFRAQNLLSGQPFSVVRYLRALAGKS